MDSKQLALETARVLSEKQAIDIRIIEISQKSSIADYLIVTSGGSDRQVGGLSDAVEERMDELGQTPKSIAGRRGSGWVLMDYGDVIVNIFNPELRERYNLEGVWGDCKLLEFEE